MTRNWSGLRNDRMNKSKTCQTMPAFLNVNFYWFLVNVPDSGFGQRSKSQQERLQAIFFPWKRKHAFSNYISRRSIDTSSSQSFLLSSKTGHCLPWRTRFALSPATENHDDDDDESWKEPFSFWTDFQCPSFCCHRTVHWTVTSPFAIQISNHVPLNSNFCVKKYYTCSSYDCQCCYRFRIHACHLEK